MAAPALTHSRSPATPILQTVATGLTCGFLAIVQSAGFGTLLIGNQSTSFIPAAIGMSLFASAVMALIVPFTSSGRGVIAISQSIPIAALSGAVGAVLASTGAGAPEPAVLATVTATVGISTLAIGIASSLLGYFRLGSFIRFVPFPVIGGFLAGSGWVIAQGGVGVVTGLSSVSDLFASLSDPESLVRIGAVLAFLAAVAILTIRLPIGLVLPAAAMATILLFNLVVAIGGVSGDVLRANGWTITMPEGQALWPPIRLSDLLLVDWRQVLHALISLPTVVILSVIAVLMNGTGIEMDARRDLDLDRELRSVGLSNILAGLGGGLPGFHSVSLTLLASRLGAVNPFVGLTVSVLCTIALFYGDIVLALVPTPLLGGLLIWIGLGLLVEWLVRSYSKISIWEYLVILLIFSVIVGAGFAWGILFGLIAAVVLFAVEYGRVDIVRHMMTGQDYQSSNDTSEGRRDLLRQAGDAILILRLQGFIFFGTADRLRKRIQERIDKHEGSPIRFLLVDFRRVSGLDSSTVLSFIRLSQTASGAGFVLVLTGMSESVQTAMVRGGMTLAAHAVHVAPDLDHGLEWCENQLLSEIAPNVIGTTALPVADILTGIVGDRRLAESLVPEMERVEVAPGGKLIVQGEPSLDIYFIEAGRAAVEFAAGPGHNIRVATVGRGSIVGEIAFYLATTRSASVVAETPVVAWRFRVAELEALRAANPEAVIAFHRGMAAMLADRLSATNQLVRLLAD